MGIRVYCPNGHRLNLKSFLAGKRGICPRCGAKFDIPADDSAQPGDTTGDDIAVLSAAAELPRASDDASPPAPAVAGFEQAITVSSPGDFEPAAIAAAMGSQPLASDSAGFASIAVPAPVASDEFEPGAATAAASPLPSAAAASKSAPQMTTATVFAAAAAGDPAASSGPLGKETILAAPAATWYVLDPVHGQFGPATDDTLRQWVAEGRITDKTLLWREGLADWRSASSLLSAAGSPAVGASGRAGSLATLDLSALAAASGAALSSSGALGAPGQRAAARRKSNQTMRIVSLALTIAVTLLMCVLIYVLTR